MLLMMVFILVLFIGILHYVLDNLEVSRRDISTRFAVGPGVNKIDFNELEDVYNLRINDEFILDVDYNEGYTFSENTDLFDINESTGVISFVPNEAGVHPSVIVAMHNSSDFIYKVVLFNVGT